jgi:chromosome segregation ATPase
MYSARLLAPMLLGASMLIGLALGPENASAQVERRGGGGENTALIQQYQQALADRSQLQAENAQLKQQLDDSNKQLEALKRQVASLRGQVGTLQAGASSSQSALQQAQATSQTYQKAFADARGKLQDLIDHYRQTVATLQGIEVARARLQQQLAQSRAAFDQCATRNYQLYQVDDEVLKRYEHQGMFSYLERAEPFTRLKRTQIENFVDDYRERAEELRVPARGSVAPAAAAAPAPPNASGTATGTGAGTSTGAATGTTPPQP